MGYSKGIMWLDDCRIPFVDEGDTLKKYFKVGGNTLGAGQYGLNDGRKTRPTNKLEGTSWENTQGRFTPNLLVCDDMLNENTCGGGLFPITSNGRTSQGDKGSNSRYYDLDKWFDNMLDEL